MATDTLFDRVQERSNETFEAAQDRIVDLNETIAGFVVDRFPGQDLVERLPLLDQLPTPASMLDRMWSVQSKALEMQGEMIERNKVFAERLLASWEPKSAAKPAAAKSSTKKAASAS